MYFHMGKNFLKIYKDMNLRKHLYLPVTFSRPSLQKQGQLHISYINSVLTLRL